jgi:hypothetical protein
MSARDVEIAEERAAIIAEACKISQDEAEKRTIAIWERRRGKSKASVHRAADRPQSP